MMIIVVIVVGVVLNSCNAYSGISSKALHTRGRIQKSRLNAKAATVVEKPNYFTDEITEALYESMKIGDSDTFKYDNGKELSILSKIDVGLSANFWDATYPNVKKRRIELGNDTASKIELDDMYYGLVHTGFERRAMLESKAQALDEEQTEEAFQNVKASPAALIRAAAFATADTLELRKSRLEQLKEKRQKQMLERNKVMKLVPQKWHKYIDYLVSLRKDPSKSELIRNVGVATMFSFIVGNNGRARMACLYSLVGNLMIMSILLTRNMPKVDAPMGMDRNKVVNWSKQSFKTAIGVTFLPFITTGVVVGLVMSAFPAVEYMLKIRAALCSSLLMSAVFTSFFEVFEDKAKGGWRWKKALEGMGGEGEEDRLKGQVWNLEGTGTDRYDNRYDPQIDDFPRVAKYIDEDLSEPEFGQPGAEEDEDQEHFIGWMKARKDSRRAPVTDISPETPWVGGKEGMYVSKQPTWLNKAYTKMVLGANKWRGKPSKYVKDTSEFDPIDGDVGFRDKRAEWLDLFGTGIWEEQIAVSRKAARAFGSYRKCMWRRDPKVVLQRCDGAEKGLRKKK